MIEAHILLVEDDQVARMLLAEGLERAGYKVTQAPNGEMAVNLLDQQIFDLVVTDIKMRRVDGVQVLQVAKRQPYQPAVVLLTGFGSLETSLAALRAGAYDYLLKPCDPPELLRVVGAAIERRAMSRRQNAALQTIANGLALLRADTALPPDNPPTPLISEHSERYLQVGDLRIDTSGRTVMLSDKIVHLTTIEYDLLCCLAEHPGQALSYVAIVRYSHGHNIGDAEAQLLLKTHIRNLRQKISPGYLENVRGFGYKLVVPES